MDVILAYLIVSGVIIGMGGAVILLIYFESDTIREILKKNKR